MPVWSIILIIIAVVIIILLIRAIYEAGSIQLTEYGIHSSKIKAGDEMNAIFISDLHSRQYGKDNCDLLGLVKKAGPDRIFIGGDLINGRTKEDGKVAISLIKELCKIAPVYYCPGNHEYKLQHFAADAPRVYNGLMEAVKDSGVVFLQNETVKLNDSISLLGLDIPYEFYNRKDREMNFTGVTEKCLGKPDKNRYNILLAHTPRFFVDYASFGADMILAGHNHGGIIRLSHKMKNGGGIISPYVKLFPKYCVGHFKKDDSEMIVSAGSGSHDIHLRLNNKPEIIQIRLYGDKF